MATAKQSKRTPAKVLDSIEKELARRFANEVGARARKVIFGDITYQGYSGIESADVLWSDGGTGVFTPLVVSEDITVAIDSYYATHIQRGLTYYQPPSTHDSHGNVTYRPPLMGPLAYVTATSPNRTHVYSEDGGTLLATFTENAKTVHLNRTNRTFTEQKPAFTDFFKRERTEGWGPSPSGGDWGAFNGSDADYFVADDLGKIHPSAAGSARYVRLDDIVKEVDARLAVSINCVPIGGSNSIALILGFQTTGNHIRLRLTVGTSGAITASISEVVSAVDTVLDTARAIHTSYAPDDIWWIRGTYDGIRTYRMYAWKDGDTEPTTPTLSYTYPSAATFPTGKIGARVVTASGTTNDPTFEFHQFSSTNATRWPIAPQVTHDIWVRTMDAPFDGTVDIGWLMPQLVNDTQDDILAIAMQYISNAATVMDGSVQIAGDAEYGPLYNTHRSFDLGHASDGTRQEGADWNDYLGINGSIRYTHLAIPKTDSPEEHQFKSLDCSGFTRMIFGYRLNLPLCLEDCEDFDGNNIPRRATQQQEHGPGNYLIPHNGTMPPADFSMLLPGDILFFDADEHNPEEQEGQIDHQGIYLGIDDNDFSTRFISSRKSISGPTFSDLAGNSAISGADRYARRFRAARRY